MDASLVRDVYRLQADGRSYRADLGSELCLMQWNIVAFSRMARGTVFFAEPLVSACRIHDLNLMSSSRAYGMALWCVCETVLD